jgi:hypothetical protein
MGYRCSVPVDFWIDLNVSISVRMCSKLQNFISEYFWQMCCLHLKRTTPSVKNEKNMQTAPSARDDTVHKNIIPKWTAPSVNKLNYNKKTDHQCRSVFECVRNCKILHRVYAKNIFNRIGNEIFLLLTFYKHDCNSIL